MQPGPGRKRSIRVWQGALLWLVVILAWQTFQHDRHQQAPQAVVEEELANAQRGRSALFATCAACHSYTTRENRIGPPLVDVLGARAGVAPGFAYSEAMRTSGLVWDRDTLRRFLMDPVGTVPGTAMAISGLSADDAEAVINYLEGKK